MFLTYFYYVLIFLFPLGQLDRYDLGNGIVFHLTDLVVLLIAILWLVSLFIKRNFSQLLTSPYAKPITVFIGCCFLSLLVNGLRLTPDQLVISSFYLIRWVSYAAIFFIVSSFSLLIKKRILTLLIISQSVLLLLGFVQYFLYPDLRNLFYLGWDEHLFRLFSTLLDPNFAAVQFNLFIFLLIGLLFSPQVLKDRKRLIVIGLSIFSLIGLLLTYSRSGYLMFAVGSTALLVLLRKKRLILYFLFILIIGIVALPKDLHSAGVELWRTASITARTVSANQAISIIRDNPVFGVGFNTYRYAQKKYGYIEPKSSETTHSGAGTDNSFLFVLATTGIVGFISYIFLWFTVIRKVYMTYKKSSGLQYGLSAVFLASCIGLFINTFFINSLFYPYMMFWMWTLLGLTEWQAGKKSLSEK